jgi:neutral ceramidase
VQGTNTTDPTFSVISGILSIPTSEQVKCQSPKPILMNVGRATIPIKWVPTIVPISIFRIGQLFILNVPAEFTTMAGRRLRNAVNESLIKNGFDQRLTIVIAGLSNSYSSYVTTIEEYGGQRYEAASTLYGPFTLDAYIQEFKRLVNDLMTEKTSRTTKGPPNSTQRIANPPRLAIDTIRLGKRFGSIVTDANKLYQFGDTVTVSFRSANPRNNLRTNGTFLTVDLFNETDGTWQTKYVDNDWCTRYYWTGGLSLEGFYWGSSFANITWTIPEDSPRGLYRVCHYGTRLTIFGSSWIRGVYNLVNNIFKKDNQFSDKGQHFKGFSFTEMEDFQGCSQQLSIN